MAYKESTRGMHPEDVAYSEGFDAGWDADSYDLGYHYNPYAPGSVLGQAWEEGFMDGYRDAADYHYTLEQDERDWDHP